MSTSGAPVPLKRGKDGYSSFDPLVVHVFIHLSVHSAIRIEFLFYVRPCAPVKLNRRGFYVYRVMVRALQIKPILCNTRNVMHFTRIAL
jgi:hypothetical protein